MQSNRALATSLMSALFVVTAAALTAQSGTRDSTKPKQAAQAPQRATADVALIADSVANAGDSLAAYAMLDSAVRTNKRDASAWHRYGMMAWSMARSSRGKFINHSPMGVRYLLAADSAMHLAVTFAPDSAAFWRDLARFYLNGGSTFVRLRAQDYVTKGLRSAERVHDKILTAELADERGMILWRRYETDANKALAVDPELPGARGYNKDQEKKGVAIRRDKLVESPTGFSGMANYKDAVQMFEYALNANPQYARARRHIYMALAERKQWPELVMASNKQLAAAPWDWDAWLALGLGKQRLNQSKEAATAFDSALAIMTPEARAEYKRVTRILPPHSYGRAKNRLQDSVAFSALSPGEQELNERMIWAMVDPLAATPDNEFRTEFFARVAYSDIRWTSDDLDHRGANSDRGDIHIRYGPPDLIIGSTWRWNFGFSITFTEPPTYGTGYLGLDALEIVDDMKVTMPMKFDNVPVAKLMEPLDTRLTAFRGARDSLDVVVAASVPTANMLHGSEIGGTLPFNISARVIDGRVETHELVSTVKRFNSDSVPNQLSQHWTQHVGPGVNVVRVEAYQPDTRRIARTVMSVDEARPTGFGMSDILIGARPEESAAAPERWRDVKIEPLFGTFRVGEPIGIVWENYELKPENGDVRYRVSINVERKGGSGVGGLLARVRSAIGNAVLGQANGLGNIEMEFPRTEPARSVTVDAITLDLGRALPGVFQLRVQVTDLVTQKKTQRVTEFRVVE